MTKKNNFKIIKIKLNPNKKIEHKIRSYGIDGKLEKVEMSSGYSAAMNKKNKY